MYNVHTTYGYIIINALITDTTALYVCISCIYLTNVILLLQMGGCRKSKMCEIYYIILNIIMYTFHTISPRLRVCIYVCT